MEWVLAILAIGVFSLFAMAVAPAAVITILIVQVILQVACLFGAILTG